jgi:hypothetical protein
MNEQLSNALVDVIKAGKDGVVNLALFAQQQAPDLVRQIVSWGLFSNIFECIIEVTTVIVIWLLFKNWAANDFKENDNPLALMFMILGSILFVIMFICFVNSGETVIKCLVSPKLYLIDYVKTLISK